MASKILLKDAAPKWVKAFRAGILNPENVQRVAQQMDPGKFRTIKPLGHGFGDLHPGNISPGGQIIDFSGEGGNAANIVKGMNSAHVPGVREAIASKETVSGNDNAKQRIANMVNQHYMSKGAAEHNTPAVHVNSRSGKQIICPHCGRELTESGIYKDKNGKLFCPRCLRKGKGSIKIAAEEEPGVMSQIWEHIKANPKSYAALSGALAGAGTYAWNRRIRGGTNPEQSPVAKSIREKGLGITTPRGERELSPLMNYIRYGSKHVKPETPHSYVGDVSHWNDPKHPDVVLSPTTNEYGEQKYKKKILGMADHHPATVGNKYEEAKLFNTRAPDAMPQTSRVSDAPKVLDSSFKMPPTDDEIRGKLENIQAKLRADRPGGYILKSVDDAQSGGRLLTDTDHLAGRYQRIKDIPIAERTSQDRLQYDHIKSLVDNPHKMMSQDKLQLQQQDWYDRLTGFLAGNNRNKTQEYRVHALDGQVLPATVARYGPMSQLANLVGIRTPAMRRAEQMVSETVKKLPKDFTNNRTFAFDVGMTPEGPKIIESNPSGYSGFLYGAETNPSVPKAISQGISSAPLMHRIVSHLQGRDTHALAGAKGLAAGIGTAGILGGAALLKPEEEQTKLASKNLLRKIAEGALGSGPELGQSATIPPRPTEGDGSSPAGGEELEAIQHFDDPLDEEVFDLPAIKAAVAPIDEMVGTEETQIPLDNTGVEFNRRARRYSTDWPTHSRNLLQTCYQDSGAAGAQGKTLAPSSAGQDRSYQSTASAAQPPATEDLPGGMHVSEDSSTLNTGPLKHLSA